MLQLGLAESTDFHIITESLKQQFSPKGNELEWQRRLQTRRQQPEEQLVQYAGALWQTRLTRTGQQINRVKYSEITSFKEYRRPL